MTTPQRVMITAGAAGIGLAIAKAFASQGAKVHICDVDETALAEAKAALPGIDTANVDVADPDAIDAWFETALADLGGLDVLINNAGIAGPTARVEDMDYDGWKQCITVCLDSQFLTSPPRCAGPETAALGRHHQHLLRRRPVRLPVPHPLRIGQVGRHRLHQVARRRAGPTTSASTPSAPAPSPARAWTASSPPKPRPPAQSEADIRADYTKSVSLRRFVEPEEIADAAAVPCLPGRQDDLRRSPFRRRPRRNLPSE